MSIKRAPWIMMALAVGMTASAATVEERLAALEAKDADMVALRAALDKVSVYGQARVRLGFMNMGSMPAKYHETSGDVRALVGVNANLDDQWLASVALATGNRPISGDARWGNDFNGKGVGFARIYMQYTPIEEVTLLAGKMSQPWISASDLIWDSWVAPEGFAAMSTVDLDDVMVLVNVGAFQVIHDVWSATADAPIRLCSAQVAGQLEVGDDAKVMGGVSLYYWDNLRKGWGPWLWNAWGQNQNNAGAAYNKNYKTYELFAMLNGQCAEMDMPYSVFAQFVDNPNGNRYKYGYLIGATLGEATEGKFQVGYDYRMVGRDSVLSGFAESTVFGGGTDGRNHRFSARYGVASAVQVGATAYLGKQNISNTQPRPRMSFRALVFDVSATF